ncbi:MAG: hypothetical protein II598_04490, partial [Elusimicrobia bacterium]|nr:hypothetical protein [Elusimicrobiota bacterium]
MAEIERKVQKIFAGGLSANGNIAKYGSKEAGTVGYSLDLDEIQTQRWLNGLAGSVSQDKAPYLQDLNAVFYTITKQLAYLFQAGVAEWNSETEYFANKSFVMYNGEMYRAIQNNTNQTPTNTTYWTKIVGLNMGIPEYNSSITYQKGQIVSYNYNDTTTILLKSLVDNNTSAPSFSPSIEQGNVYQSKYIVDVIGVYNSSSSFPASANSNDKALSLNDFTIYTFKSGSWVGTFNLKQLSADYITIKDLSTNNLWQYAYINGSGDTMINIMDSARMYPPAKKWLVINPFVNNRICVYNKFGKTIYSDGYIELTGNIQ